jgi:uncharacterized damage-inducible protein DinB
MRYTYAMTTQLIHQLLALFDAGFDGPDWHSLLGNLRAVTEDDWRWVPAGGARSIRDIVLHAGGAKHMYFSNAFGDRSLDWESPLVLGEGRCETLADALEWLREAHRRFRDAVAKLDDDAELSRPRPHHSRHGVTTEWIILVMIQHDLYHAGEINHIRALKQGDDE